MGLADLIHAIRVLASYSASTSQLELDGTAAQRIVPVREPHSRPSRSLYNWPMKHVTIISALWLWGIILLVLYGACYWRNCLKLQTVSYAADSEPMLSLYRIGMIVYAILYSAFLRSVYIYFKVKMLLYQVPYKPHLQQANSFGYALGIVAMSLLIAQSLIPLHVSKSLHNGCGFAFLGLAAVNIGISSLLFRILQRSSKEHAVWRTMFSYLMLMLFLALMTFFQASFAYQWKTYWVNSEILAWSEMSTSLGASIYPILYRGLLKYMYIDGTFHVGILHQLGLARTAATSPL